MKIGHKFGPINKGLNPVVLAKYLVGMTNYQRPDLLPTWKAKILFEG